jgi:peptidoglycan/LPS O-acetylase OafA/YrhL
LNWNYPSWSISSEWFAYLIFPVTVAGAVRLGLTRTGAAAVMAVCLLGGSVAFVLFWRPLPYYELLLVVPTFLLGVAGVWAVRDRSPVSPARARWVETALAGALIAIPFAPHPDLVVSLLLVTSFLLILALGLSRGRCHPFWKFWPIVFVGEVSYSLYMTHTLAQKILYKLLPSVRFFDSNLFTRLGVVGAYVMFIVVCCLLMYYLVERPCRARVRRATRNEGTVLDALPETSSERTMPRPDRMAAPRGSDRGIAAGVIQ